MQLKRLSDQQNREWKQAVQENSLATKTLKHWEEHRPKMCAGLASRNLLYQSVMTAAKLTSDLMVQLWKQGLEQDKIQEIALREWVLLPDEKDQPSLTFDPAMLPADRSMLTSG